ncbi:MAG: Ig-like domain-containing protein [Firmicutes bacterium]|nr:Ig-like domain-containing protein [Bacillota bacterium]
MKKRFLRILAAVLLMSLLMTQSVYADSLTIESIYPEDGATGMQTTNQMARIVFSSGIDAEANADCFKILDSEGNEQEILVLDQPEEPERVNLVLVGNLEDSSEYTIVIDGKVTDMKGNQLGAESKTTFKTRSLKTDGIITTVMMVVMMVGIVVFTIRDQAKKTREAEEAAAKKSGKPKVEKSNPYKDAKKEAERIRAQKQKEKERKVREQMRKNEAKANAKKRKK